jgi:AcrR family transcriptional regulator
MTPSSRPRLGRPPLVDVGKILDAAETVGLDRLTTAAVAARLGVSEPTIRHHVTSTDRLYTLASARLLDRLDPTDENESTWRDYLGALCQRLAGLVRTHPGLESYVVHGPYTPSTLELFDRILAEVTRRSPGMTDETAYMLASRAIILTASTAGIPSTRYPEGVEPEDRRDALFAWMVEAFLTGAEQLVADGRVPQLPPTKTQPWAHTERH